MPLRFPGHEFAELALLQWNRNGGVKRALLPLGEGEEVSPVLYVPEGAGVIHFQHTARGNNGSYSRWPKEIMHKTLKRGLFIFGAGVAMRILAEIMWPLVKQMGMGNPATLPPLAIIGIFIVVGPICLMVGVIMSLIGVIRQGQANS